MRNFERGPLPCCERTSVGARRPGRRQRSRAPRAATSQFRAQRADTEDIRRFAPSLLEDFMFDSLMGWLSNDLAIDLGTANTLVYAKGRGLICSEPSVVAVTSDPSGRGDKVLAVGHEAKEMLGRTPGSIRAVRPIKDGVIADFEITEAMLRYFISRANNKRRLARPRIVICVPPCITSVEKRAVRESAMSAGAREVFLIEEPMAAAIGAGLDVTAPTGNMVVDIGGGTTDVAVISLSGIVTSRSIRCGGDAMDEAVINYVKRKYNMLIGERTAESVKMAIGTASPTAKTETMEIKGRDLVAGIPKVVVTTSEEIREALQEPLAQIVETVHLTLERTPPELAADIVDRGIMLVGGGSMLKDLDTVLRQETKLPILRSEDPFTAVVYGAGRALDNLDLLKEVAIP